MESADGKPNEFSKQSGALFWIMHLIAMVPVLIVKNLPFSDYSDHLSRIAILLRDRQSPLFPSMYHTNFYFRPYLGFDVPAWLLAHVLSFDLTGKVFYLLALTLWNFGLFRLAKSRGGSGIAGCLPVLLTYNMVTIQGFLPYLAGMALVPWYLIAFSKKGPLVKSLPFLILFPLLIFASHQLALLLFIMGAFCFLFDSEGTKQSRRAQGIQIGLLLVLNLVYFKLAKFGGTSQSIEFGGIEAKAHNLSEAFLTGSLRLDYLFVGLVFIVVVALLVRKTFALNRLAIALIVIPFLAFAVAPIKLGLAENFDYRFVLFGLSLAFAVLTPQIKSKKDFSLVAAALVTLALFRSGYVGKGFLVADERLEEARIAMKNLPGTPALIVSTIGEHSQWQPSQWKPMPYSVANFAPIDRTAYVNTIFQEPSMMTITFGDIGRAFDYVGRHDGRATPEGIWSLLNDAGTRVQQVFRQEHPPVQFYAIIVSSDLEPLPKIDDPTYREVVHGSYFSIYELPTQVMRF
ncbi:MAG: hypothetical protein JST51_11125 [Armatimonadetes bacterium]|nr:hypothetical protein [Armatimonadota bacterium]